MQQKTSNFTNYFKYGISIGFMALLFLIYQVEFKGETQKTNPKKVEADFFINDQPQQQHFQNTNSSSSNNITSFSSLLNSTGTLNETLFTCQCPASLYSTENITLVRHGEKSPVFVPDNLEPIQPDILGKIIANRLEKESNGLLVTVAGYAMRTELYNWMEMLKKAHEESYVIFCTDLKLYIHLIVAGYEDKAVMIPDDWIVDDLEIFRDTETNMLDEGNPRLSHVKTWVLQRLAYVNGITNVLMLDVNQMMLHPRTREYIHTLLHIRWDTQIIATQDSSDQHTVNTGLIMLRTDAKQAKRLLSSTINIQELLPQLTQQQAFNKALDQLDLHVKSGMTVLLDIIHFPNGVNYFEKNLPGSRGIEPYIVHANHKFGEERRDLLRQHGFWKVNQDHVDGISRQVEDIFQKRQARAQEQTL